MEPSFSVSQDIESPLKLLISGMIRSAGRFAWMKASTCSSRHRSSGRTAPVASARCSHSGTSTSTLAICCFSDVKLVSSQFTKNAKSSVP